MSGSKLAGARFHAAVLAKGCIRMSATCYAASLWQPPMADPSLLDIVLGALGQEVRQ